MNDPQLFALFRESVRRIPSGRAKLEKDLEALCADYLKDFFDVYFLKRQYRTGNVIIDTIGIDSQGSPVIFEYKRDTNNTAINQAVHYAKIVRDRQKDFEDEVRKKYPKLLSKINFNKIRVICVAKKFEDRDETFVETAKNKVAIELVNYQMFDDKFICFEWYYPKSSQSVKKSVSSAVQSGRTESPSSSALPGKIFSYSNIATGIHARIRYIDNQFVLLKNSKIRLDTFPSLFKFNAALAARRQAIIDKHRRPLDDAIVILRHDERASSLSAIDAFVTGNRISQKEAKKRWQTEDGRSMHDFETTG